MEYLYYVIPAVGRRFYKDQKLMEEFHDMHQPYDGIAEGSIVFCPDSQKIAYWAKVDDKWSVFINGKDGKKYDRVISGGGEKIIFDSSDKFHYLAIKDSNIYLVEEIIKK